MKKLYFLIIPLIFISGVSFGYTSKQETQIIQMLDSIDEYEKQIVFLNKIPARNKNESDFILSQKKKIIQLHLKNILKEARRDYESRQDIYHKYFKVLQSVDAEASINPYYFEKLKEKIHENDIYLKAFIYIFYQIKEQLNTNKNYYENYQEILKHKIENNSQKVVILDSETFQYLKKKGFHYLSRTDLQRFKKYILENKVGYDAKKFQYYLNYESFLKNIPSNSIFLTSHFTQKLQEKNLSCEVNSASLFASYLLKQEISEENILSYIPQYKTPLKKINQHYIWGNPYKEFVGDISGKQTKVMDKMTGYGVYAHPISHALDQIGIKNKVTSFDQDIIVKSLLENEPVIFWYLSRTSLGALNTTPVSWKTHDNKIIKGYIGEHTGVIVGISFSQNGAIDQVYFYEGRNTQLQSVSFKDLSYQASFFHMMISQD